MPGELTRPHDYRVLLEACPDLTIVGGQAVNVWAITYLDPQQTGSAGFGSGDLDVLAGKKVDEIIEALPGWQYEKTPLWAFTESRVLKLVSRAEDGRLLVVEVLHSVLGLGREDLEAVEVIEHDGVTYRLLDPIAMLKAKAANVRKIDQKGPPPRQDRAHLQLISKCVPYFLLDAHQQALQKVALRAAFSKTMSRAFKTLSDRRTLKTLLQEGIPVEPLVPTVLRDSPIEKIRTACQHQLPRLAMLTQRYRLPS
jgi:hypothetical protein